MGLTSRFLKTRFTEHCRHIKMSHKIDNFLHRHFKLTNHSPSHIAIQLVENIYMML